MSFLGRPRDRFRFRGGGGVEGAACVEESCGSFDWVLEGSKGARGAESSAIELGR